MSVIKRKFLLHASRPVAVVLLLLLSGPIAYPSARRQQSTVKARRRSARGVSSRLARLQEIRLGPRRPEAPEQELSRLVRTAALDDAVDALDTMILMGLKDEATDTKNYIIQNLSLIKIFPFKTSKSRSDCWADCFRVINSPATSVCWRWPRTWEIGSCPSSIRLPECPTVSLT